MKLLFIVPYMPTVIRTRPYHLIRALRQRGHAITLASLWEKEAERQAAVQLEQEGVQVLTEHLDRRRIASNLLGALPGRLPLQARYSWHPGLARRIQDAAHQSNFDAIHVEHLRGAMYGLTLSASLRRSCPPIIWDSVDCISSLFEQAARYSKSRFGRWAASFDLRRTQAYESWLMYQFCRVLVTSQADRLALTQLALSRCRPDGRSLLTQVDVLPNGVDTKRFKQADQRYENVIIFTGKMRYHANTTAAHSLIQEVMPRVWTHRAQTEVWIVGQDPPAWLYKHAKQEPRLKVMGGVPDLGRYLGQATVAAAPIIYGAGIQNKVLEAMACGTPLVASPAAVQAIHAQPGHDLLVAEGAQDFAVALLRLLDDARLRQQIGEQGRAYVVRNHDWDSIAERLEKVYLEAKDRAFFEV